jgi:hypothetical protein
MTTSRSLFQAALINGSAVQAALGGRIRIRSRRSSTTSTSSKSGGPSPQAAASHLSMVEASDARKRDPVRGIWLSAVRLQPFEKGLDHLSAITSMAEGEAAGLLAEEAAQCPLPKA